MTAATERKIIRWIHLIASIPIIGYIYGPVSERPEAVIVVRFILFPLVVLTGLWMWKGYLVKRWLSS
jgi:thiosulfate reductase cytochrome b subunit